MSHRDPCARFCVTPAPTSPTETVGIAIDFSTILMPLNGLRHPREGNASGWFLWAGEEFPDADDAFQPHHAQHLLDSFPEIAPYLSLPPGWRFLLAPGYEDIWFDENLLNI